MTWLLEVGSFSYCVGKLLLQALRDCSHRAWCDGAALGDLAPPLKVVWRKNHQEPSSGWDPAIGKPVGEERWARVPRGWGRQWCCGAGVPHTEGPAAAAGPWTTGRGGSGFRPGAEGGLCLLGLLLLLVWFPGCRVRRLQCIRGRFASHMKRKVLPALPALCWLWLQIWLHLLW